MANDATPELGVLLKVKIGIVDADRVVEIETEDPEALRNTVDAAFASGTSMLWFEDTKKRLVGIPRDKLAFVEIEQESGARSRRIRPGQRLADPRISKANRPDRPYIARRRRSASQRLRSRRRSSSA